MLIYTAAVKACCPGYTAIWGFWSRTVNWYCFGQLGGGGGGANSLHANIHFRFRHADHKTKDWLPGLGSQGRKGKGAIVILKKVEKHKWIKKKVIKFEFVCSSLTFYNSSFIRTEFVSYLGGLPN